MYLGIFWVTVILTPAAQIATGTNGINMETGRAMIDRMKTVSYAAMQLQFIAALLYVKSSLSTHQCILLLHNQLNIC